MGKLSHCNHYLEKDLATKTERFKLYKAGKLWLVAGVATFSFGLAQLGVTVDAHADVAATDTTDVSGQATGSQTIQQKEVALSANSATSNTATSGTVATTSSSAAETVGDDSNATNSNVTTGETGATETTTTDATATDKTATDVPSVEVPATLDDSDVTTKTVSSEETQATNASASNSSTNNVVRYKNQIGAVSTDGTSTATDTTGTTDGTTADGTTTATAATDKLPAGFSVSDPDYAAGTYAASVKNTGDQYTYFEVATNGVDLALSTDRSTATKTYVTVAKSTGDAWNVITTQDITDKKQYTDTTTGLTVHNDSTSVYVTALNGGNYQIVTNVFGYLNGEYSENSTTLKSWSGDAVLKPIQQTQTTNYVDQNGNQIADSVQLTGLSGQKYTTEPSTEISGYDVKASDNADGDMSPFMTDGQTMTEIIYKSNGSTGALWGTLTYTVKDVNKGTIDWKFVDTLNNGQWNDSGTLTYDPTAEVQKTDGFSSYTVINPYIPQTTTITYAYDATSIKVNVKHVDEEGHSIGTAVVLDGKFNEAIPITPSTITGYTYNQDFAATATDNATSYTVTSLADDNTVILHYTANPETLVIKHVDEDGNEIATVDDQTVTSTYNTNVQLTEVDKNYNITGYELATDMPRTYTMVDGENVVTLSYIQQQPITVNYVDQAGQAIDQTLITNPETSLAGIVGETVSVPSPTITGYTAYATNPTNYTVIDGDNAITLKYVKTKVTVSVDDDGNIVDGNGNKVTAGTAVDGSQGTGAPVWPTSLTDDGLTGNDQNTNPDVNKDDLDRAIRETVYTLDQTGKVILPSNVWAYFTRTATVDFSNPDKPTVSFGDWTAAAGPQTVADVKGTDFQPALDYELAQDVTDKAGQSWYLFDATGKALTPATLMIDDQTFSGLAAQQVTPDSKDSTFYIVFTNDKTFTRTINYVNQADQSVVADKVTQTVTYHQIPTLTVTAGNPTVTLGDWTTTAADFAAIDSPTVTGLYALTQTTPVETTDPATSAATESLTVTYVAGQQTVAINYVGLPDTLKPTQTSISGDTGTTTTLTPTEVTGYQADAKQYDVSFAVGEDGTLVTPSITVTYVAATHGYTITPVTEDNVEIGTPIDEQGTTATTISDGDYPDVEGYTVKPGQNLTVPAGDTPISVIYTPNTVTQKITIPSTTQKGDGTVIDETPVEVEVTGKTGEAVSITVPPKTGYTTNPTTITGTVNPNGTITIPDTTTITYEPKTATQTISIPSTMEDSDGNPTDSTPVTVDVTGKTGDQVPITVPTKTGYTPSQSTVMGTVNPDGTITIPDETTIVYTPNPVKQTIPVPSTTENSSGKVIDDTPVNVEVVGKTGDAVSVTVPPKAGYTPEQATIPATINDDGTVTIPADTTITYQPNTVTQTVTIPTETADSDGTITEDTTPFTIKKTGKTGDSVEITLPIRDGYTTTTPVITATVEPDGTIKVPDGTKVTYTPNEVTQTVTVPTATEGVDGTITDDAKPFTVEETGKTGDAIEITLPPKAGYTPDHATVTATVNDDGTITIPEDETVTYKRNTVTRTVTIPTDTAGSDGTITDDDKPFTIEETGKTGDAIEITVPSRDGYTTAPATVTATVTPDGTITTPTGTKVTYTPKEFTDTVTIPSTTQDGDGATTDETPISVEVTGKTGEEVPIAVPEKPGYTASQTTVTGTVKPDGTISVPTDTTIIYTPKEFTNTITVPTATEGNDGIVTEDTTPFTVEKTGKTGDSIEVTLPPKAGYTPDQATVTATVNDDGTITIPKDETVTYKRNTVTRTVTIPTATEGSDGTITDDAKPFTIEETGKTGDAIEITVPSRDGYTTAPATVTATVTPDGTITIPTGTKVTYTPKEFTNTVTIPSTTKDGDGKVTDETPISVEVTGKTGEEVPITVPEKPGYIASQTTVTGTVNPDGTISIPEETTITYTPKETEATVSIPSTTKDGDGKVTDETPISVDVTGKTGEEVPITVPEKPGYTASQTTVTGTVKPDGTISIPEETTITYTPKETEAKVSIPSTTKDGDGKVTDETPISVDVTGKTGEEVPIAVPEKPGYTASQTIVTGTVNPDGTISVPENTSITYTPNPVTNTVSIPSITPGSDGGPDDTTPVVSDPITGHTGDVVTVDVPTKTGYTPSQTTVTGTINPDGTITTTDKVTYTPKSVTKTVSIPSTTMNSDKTVRNDDPVTSVEVTGKTGDHVTVPVPAKDGYTSDKETVTGIVNPDGTISTTETVAYTPNDVTGTISIPTVTKGGNTQPATSGTISTPVSGATGDTVTVAVEGKPGYSQDKTTVTGTVNPDGTITTTETVTYTPNKVTGSIVVPTTTKGGNTLPTTDGSFTSTPVTGVTGDTVTVAVEDKPGYSQDKTTVTGTINPDGTITTTEKVTYTPNSVTKTVAIPSTTFKDNKTTVDNNDPVTSAEVTGVTGDNVTIAVPDKPGYIADKTTVTGVVNPNGTITTTEKVTYTPNSVTSTITIPSTTPGNDGGPDDTTPAVSDPVTGFTGETVTVDVPAKAGYTPSQPTVTGTVNPDGTITTTDKVTYTPNTVNKTVSISSNTLNGDDTVRNDDPVTSAEVTGKTGDHVTVPVPAKAGYTPNKTTVTGVVNPDGTITTTETVEYTPIATRDTVTIPSTTLDGKGDTIDKNPVTSTPVNGVTGDKVTVPVPTKEGYMPDKTTVTGVINPDGTITTTETVKYTPTAAKGTVSIPSTTVNGKDDTIDTNPVTSTPVNGVTGDKVTVPVPAKEGYTPNKTTVTGVINPDGTITTTETVKYTPTAAKGTVSIPSTTVNGKDDTIDTNPVTSAPVTGVTGDKVTVPVPTKEGYTSEKTTVTGVVNPDGTITTTETVKYTPTAAKGTVSIPSTTVNGKDDTIDTNPVTSTPVNGVTGDKVTVPVPTKEGYTPDKTTVTGVINPDGTITTTETVKYTPTAAKGTVSIPSTTVNGKDDTIDTNPVTSAPVTGVTGDKVTVPVPTKEGYTSDKTTITGVVNPDGTITTTETVKYTPTAAKGAVTIPTTTINGDGDTIATESMTSTPVSGVTGDKVTVPVPAKEGYTPDNTTVTGVINPDGTITTTDKVTYKPNPASNTVAIPTTTINGDGDTIATESMTSTPVSGVTGDKVTVTVPTKQGYTPDETTVTGVINPDGIITTTDKVTYKPNPVTSQVTISTTTPGSNGDPATEEAVTSTPVSGVTGDTVTVPVPPKPGYTPDKATVTGVVNPDGTITTTDKVNYSPNPVNDTISIPATTFNGDGGTIDTEPVTSALVNGVTGDKVTVAVPTKQGYHSDMDTITGVINPDGTITTTDKVTYTPDTVNGTVSISTTTDNSAGEPVSTKTVTSTPVTAETGDAVIVDVPTKLGYTPNRRTVLGIVNPNGTITTVDKVTYDPNPVETTVSIPSTTLDSTGDPVNKQPVTSAPVDGSTGDTVTVDVPTKPGYTPSQSTVTGTVNPDGTITTKDKVTYTPNAVTNTVSIPSTTLTSTGTPVNSQPVTSAPVDGHTGDTVTVDVPTKQGYTPSQTTVTGTINPDGTITTKDKVTYTPNAVTNTVSIPSTTVDSTGTPVDTEPVTSAPINGHTGDTVEVNVPSKPGYTPSQATVTGTIEPDGSISTKDKVTYTPNTVTTTVSIPSTTLDSNGEPTTDAPVMSANVTGKTGDSITIPVPTKPGYTPNQTTITGVINPDGTITTKDKVTYTPNTVTGTIAIPTQTIGGDGKTTPTDPVTSQPVTGKTGDTVTVAVPNKPGYTADKTTVTGVINPDGTITTTEVVTYTLIPVMDTTEITNDQPQDSVPVASMAVTPVTVAPDDALDAIAETTDDDEAEAAAITKHAGTEAHTARHATNQSADQLTSDERASQISNLAGTTSAEHATGTAVNENQAGATTSTTTNQNQLPQTDEHATTTAKSAGLIMLGLSGLLGLLGIRKKREDED